MGRGWDISAVWVGEKAAVLEDEGWEGALWEAAVEIEKEVKFRCLIAYQKPSLPVQGSLAVTWIKTPQLCQKCS